MIKPNELRVGITLNIFKPEVVGFQPVSIDKPRLIALLNGEETTYYPIPLTPEILDKFWFEKENDYWICGGLKIWKNEGSGKAFYHINSELLINLDYVHELQNLYWCVCGEELEIKSVVHQ